MYALVLHYLVNDQTSTSMYIFHQCSYLISHGILYPFTTLLYVTVCVCMCVCVFCVQSPVA